ncbi:AAEL011783-PA [Aedes aegypti]|uniref:AAEL011783-PA n=1 Tax=Aedes aegypti TaxID=7159 RepID=Q16P26_AEDAE|nr:AAEL011783-PA [Aedes aegypti]
MVPASYTAQMDDLDIQLQTEDKAAAELMANDATDLKLQISHVKPTGGTTISLLDIKPDANHNVTQIKIPCGYFMHGGLYELSIEQPAAIDAANAGMEFDERLRQQLNVSWPTPTVSLVPSTISTYPEELVRGSLQFADVRCPNAMAIDDDSVDVPEFWLELVYCGHNEACPLETVSKPQILFSEQVRGFPSSRVINFRCDLFGLAGYYLLHLRSANQDPTLEGALRGARALLKADWSKQYVFTVHARSIFPCDAHSSGIHVLFQYPSCILNQSDRVRVYAKLRADVSSLVPPTSLHYIAEQRVMKGQHALYFECDLFYEKYIEYCFVYVSQAISGAVADIRMDCVPTLPVSPSDSGGWGPWSNWTHCSTTCRGGVRNRYRFCDSPPPRYGAKFCECYQPHEHL